MIYICSAIEADPRAAIKERKQALYESDDSELCPNTASVLLKGAL